MKRKWEEGVLSDGSGRPWCEYDLGLLTFVIDTPDDSYQAWVLDSSSEQTIGPRRKTQAAAHNDCKRHAKKLRAALVQFDRAKLP